jgi:cytochrome oxidase Cu insertion factor (SCO1/SenC/PrrC family)
MKIRKKVIILLTLFTLLVLPPMVYFYVTKGFNTFINLDIIGTPEHKIADFSLINQSNEIVMNDSLIGNIYIANFFFTSCPTICPIMTKKYGLCSI